VSKIVILDYGMANLRSVQKAFEKVGSAAAIITKPDQVVAADKLVVPGVGAFRDAIGRLRTSGLDRAICDFAVTGKPVLGICLGLQLFFDRSFEDGEFAGLGLFAGDVIRFPTQSGFKVPHMGWNRLRHRQPNCPILKDVPQNAAVYFVHSYFARPADPGIVASEADYPDPFAAIIWRDNLFATQFHPEKSQSIGLMMLRNFAAL